jgi:FkbM family methyltransferase
VLDANNFVIKTIHGFKIYLDKKDPGISRTLIKPKFFRKWHREPEFMDIIEKEVTKGMVAFDLGANIGYVTLCLANLIGKQGHVYAVEPSPHNFEILKKNISANNLEDRVDAYHYAISSESGVINFNLCAESNLHSIIKTKYTKETIEVNSVSIDDFFDDKKFPNFIKMDIEGAELQALEGINEILKKSDESMKILMEIHPMYYSQDKFAKQLKRLFDAGFKAKYVVSAGTARPDFFVEKGYIPNKVYTTGDWRRGVYTNIRNEDVIHACCSDFDQKVTISPWSLIKRPYRLLNPSLQSTKIVRAIMLERA